MDLSSYREHRVAKRTYSLSTISYNSRMFDRTQSEDRTSLLIPLHLRSIELKLIRWPRGIGEQTHRTFGYNLGVMTLRIVLLKEEMFSTILNIH
ncbi:hypothetical protein TNIN_102241 [Trichonephila inaurata madagascariensis]|uniref:Uncharacterized protein n=1 Tax=Trichonephila inaurata madagascariensis TaxID=2747483 RepID=A0A8X6YCV7_9ARAC|nr:hypothetical protein TNIN_102241 [Trichonephila inaurata madagascariensis]